MTLCFIDGEGGAFAALAAAFAIAAGREAIAATTAAARVPDEIRAVLGEVGLTAPAVIAAGDVKDTKSERVNVSGWGHALHDGDGALEKLALARIARDRIERRIEALLAA